MVFLTGFIHSLNINILRERVTKPTAQIGFIKYVLLPLFEALSKVGSYHNQRSLIIMMMMIIIMIIMSYMTILIIISCTPRLRSWHWGT